MELWNKKKQLGLPEMDRTAIEQSWFHWYEGSRPDPKIGKAREDLAQLMEDDLELEEEIQGKLSKYIEE